MQHEPQSCIRFKKFLLELVDDKISLTPLMLATPYSELLEVPRNVYMGNDGITAGLVCSRNVFNTILFEQGAEYIEQLDIDFEILDSQLKQVDFQFYSLLMSPHIIVSFRPHEQ